MDHRYTVLKDSCLVLDLQHHEGTSKDSNVCKNLISVYNGGVHGKYYFSVMVQNWRHMSPKELSQIYLIFRISN